MRNKLIHGVGINDATYRVTLHEELPPVNGKRNQKKVWTCPYYRKWADLLRRCYSDKYKQKYPTYIGCLVCEEWLTFSNFKSWMEKQDWEGKHLDKDILSEGGKIYSPETCIFVSARVNYFLISGNARRGNYKLGVRWHKDVGKFSAQINDLNSKALHLGYFTDESAAHNVWLKAKLKLADELCDQEGLNISIREAIKQRVRELK